jgi:hypothetical protein
MGAQRRLIYEISGLLNVFDWTTIAKYLVNLAIHAPDVIRSHNLKVVDASLKGSISLNYRNVRMSFPLSEIDSETAAFDESALFSFLREMYGHDVYLRGFTRLPEATITVDLGANRGLFAPIAILRLGAEKVIAVEPISQFAAIALKLLAVRGGHIAGVEELPGLSDEEAIQKGRELFEARKAQGAFEGFEVWKLEKMLIQHPPPRPSAEVIPISTKRQA